MSEVYKENTGGGGESPRIYLGARPRKVSLQRYRRILQLCAEGLPKRIISERMGVCVKTISSIERGTYGTPAIIVTTRSEF